MVDLRKHLERAEKAVKTRNYDLAIEVCLECQEVDPSNLANYKILVDAAKRRAKEGGKKGFGLPSLSRDPHKQLSATVKRVAKNPDLKSFAAAGDAARAVNEEKPSPAMTEVVILFYREAKDTGLFKGDVYWHLGHAYHQKFELTKDPDALEQAITTMADLEATDKSFKEAGRTMKNWEAQRSMAHRDKGKEKGEAKADYRDQLASSKEARRNEAMNRVIRSREDADEVLSFIDEDLDKNPDDKQMWVKKGDIHRRIGQMQEAKTAYQRAQHLDEHDFVVTVRIGDTEIAERKNAIKEAEAQDQDTSDLKQELMDFEIAEYRKRAERQPTELSHKYHLAKRLYQIGEIDEAASLFQRSVREPKFRVQSLRYLGSCFQKKGLLDMAVDQYNQCLSAIEDERSEEAMAVRYQRARLAEEMGKVDEAMADYTRLIEVDLSFKDAADRLNALRQ